MSSEWLAPGEEILGSWNVYLGEPSPTSAKTTGKLHITNQSVHFIGDLELRENAAIYMNNLDARRGLMPFWKSDKHIAVPFTEIGEAQIVKKKLFLKSLHVVFKSGAVFDFNFGAASPQKALDAIVARLGSG
jgi:hypothetical protein